MPHQSPASPAPSTFVHGLPPVQTCAAHRLVHEAGFSHIESVAHLTGGANNRVYKLTTPHGPLVLKHYFRHKDDPRDRLAAEYAFLTAACAAGVDCIPTVHGRDEVAGVALYSFVDGISLCGRVPSERDIDAAAAFLRSLQQVPGNTAQIGPAADACFSFHEHITGVQKRLETLDQALSGATATNDMILADAQLFLQHELYPAWNKVCASLHASHRANSNTNVSPILSPSDFGFHNALRTAHGLVFIDFEYAGYDDPAKMLCDFLCQPAVPVPENMLVQTLQHMTDAIATDASTQHIIAQRTMHLLPVHHIKWCCIMLNNFKQIDNKRRQFSSGNTTRHHREFQLQKARTWLHTQRFAPLYEVYHGLH